MFFLLYGRFECTVVDKIYTATINLVRRFNSEKSCLQIKSKHLQ